MHFIFNEASPMAIWYYAQHNDVARFTRNDAMFAKYAARHISAGIAVIISETTSFAKGKHHWKKTSEDVFFHGDPPEARTPDTRLKRAVLYLLS